MLTAAGEGGRAFDGNSNPHVVSIDVCTIGRQDSQLELIHGCGRVPVPTHTRLRREGGERQQYDSPGSAYTRAAKPRGDENVPMRPI